MSEVRILLLEDSAIDAELTLAALTRGGVRFSCDRADNRQTFIDAIEQRCPDLILADFSLPDFDGASALTIARERCPEVPFIFVSGAIGEDVAISSLRSGATDYVLKQRIDRLAAAVNRALSEARERKRRRDAEEAARTIERRHRILLESITDFAIFMTDAKGEVNTWNPGAERITGYSEQEMLGRSPALLFTPEDLQNGRYDKELRVAQSQGRAVNECWHIRKDGNRFFASGVVTCVRGEDNSLQGYVTVLRDVTDRKRSEEALRRTNTELEQFAYAASHDMQEPLRTIKSYSQMLVRRYGGKLDADGEEFLHFIETGVDHMQALLDDLLSYSHVLHERSVPVRTVPLREVVDQVIANARSSIEQTGAVITTDDLPVVTGDRSQLGQIFQNLLSNAIKYQPPGQSPRIHISASGRNGHEWTISVRDNGIGFEPEYAERIFGLFRRLHRAEYPGTGIGLALCKRIIDRQGGRIWAESKPGEGSTFHFTVKQ